MSETMRAGYLPRVPWARPGWRFAAGLTVLVVSSALALRWPAAVTLGARDQLTPLIVPGALFLWWAYRRSGSWRPIAALGATCALFLLPLAGLWLNGVSDASVVGGLLPWSDAGAYYHNAQRLLEDQSLTLWATRRAMFVAMLAMLLGATGRDLPLVLVVMVVLNATACYVATRAVQRTHGTMAAVAFLLLLFLYYRRIAGTTLTENLGFPLAVLAFALLWSAAGSRSLGQALWGIFLMTLALNARPGPFFVLPALVGWLVFAFRGSSRSSLAMASVALILVAIGFAANGFLVRHLGSAGARPFSEYPLVLYGIAVGGKGWEQIFVDHPEIRALSGPAFTDRAVRLSLEAFQANPFGPAISFGKSYLDFLVLPGPFHFIDPRPAGIENVAYRLGLAGFSFWSFWRAIRSRDVPHLSLLLAVGLGVLVSIPLAPPLDRMRPYGTIVPFLAALVAVGVAFLTTSRAASASRPVDPGPTEARAATLGAVCLLSFVGVGAFRPARASGSPPIPAGRCDAGREIIHVRLDRHSHLRLVEDSTEHSPPTAVPVSDFRHGLATLDRRLTTEINYMRLIRIFRSVDPPALLAPTLSLDTGDNIWLISPLAGKLSGQGVARACGRFVTPASENPSVFQAVSLKFLEEPGHR